MENLHLILAVMIAVLPFVYFKRRALFAKNSAHREKNTFENEENDSTHVDIQSKKKPNETYEIVLQMGYSAPNFPTDIPYTVVENDEVVNPTILIVDGNSNSCNQIALLFHNRNTVLTAENGLAALEILKATPSVSLIISDIELPIMDGFQLLTTLKAKADCCHIPFIMMTERVDLQQKLKALRIGVDDYLIKPFDKEELLVRVDNLLKNHSERLKFFLETYQQSAAQNEHNEAIILAPDELKWMEHLELYIQQHIADVNLTAEDLAEGLCVSRAQLFRRVKKLTGLTPHSYLNEVRFNYARKCLENRTHTSVKSVSYAVGMKQLSHFSHQFKLRFGKYPSDYFF
jgi:YesN/AraC family two-component response regulator